LESLIEYRDQSVDADELPGDCRAGRTSPIAGTTDVVKEKVTCGDDGCKCASRESQYYTMARISIAIIVKMGR